MTGDSQTLFTLLVAAVVLQRLVETHISSRNAHWLLARGGREAGGEHLPAMIIMHAAFLLCCPLEVWLAQRAFSPLLGFPMLLLFLLAQAVRFWTMRSLGRRWTIRIITVPGLKPVSRGPYRWVRHPNYAVVVLELFSLPLVHTAWLTALVFGLLNAWVLRVRIRVEEAELVEAGGYQRFITQRPRFVPSIHRGGTKPYSDV
ncbi:MAG: isoprenylcysteine carboxyl methyltransferase family protein [Acidobacteriota bacterium]|nr:MAG: isoprenylcysteine carboxyl methyltransferase family protein [Acidobacteriota bacterium]